MNHDEMNAALNEAERTINVVDSVVEKIARLLLGRLRKVRSNHTLRTLKNELAQYNMHTGNWRP